MRHSWQLLSWFIFFSFHSIITQLNSTALKGFFFCKQAYRHSLAHYTMINDKSAEVTAGNCLE